MTTEEHVDHLFSAAYDRDLGASDWERFSEHLKSCRRCTGEFESYRNRIESVRALPPAHMPVPVHLPTGSPRSGRAWIPAIPPVLRNARPSLRWGTGLAGVVAAVLIGAALVRGGGHETTARPQASVQRQPAAAPTGTSPGAGSPCALVSSGRLPTIGTATVAPDAAQGAAAGAAGPAAESNTANFSNRTTVTAPGRPGQTLTVATTATHVTRGATVAIFAQLAVPAAVTVPRGSAVSGVDYLVAPCVALTAQPVSATHGGADGAPQGALNAQPGTQGGAPPGAPAAAAPQGAQAAAGPPLAIGSPARDRGPAALSVQYISIPTGLAPGTVLHLEATVPGSTPHPGDPPLTAQITIVTD